MNHMGSQNAKRRKENLQGFILSVLMPGASKTLTLGLTDVTLARRPSRRLVLDVWGGKNANAMSRTATKLENRPKASATASNSLTILD